MKPSTNAVIAMVRALAHELNELERYLNDGEQPDEEWALYLNDLNEALASIADDYSSRIEGDGSLTAFDRLLQHFSQEPWPPAH